MSKEPQIRYVEVKFGSDAHKNSIDLRYKVLREPLGLVFSEEDLMEEDEYHLAAMNEDDEVIGILLLRKTSSPEVIKMRQVAIEPSIQRAGVGKGLVHFSEQFARQHGYRIMELNAREVAVPFYLKLNYRIVSDQFTEVGIPHFKMQKELQINKSSEM